jgi:hypothetical protein
VGDLLRLGGWMRRRSLLSWPVLLFLGVIIRPGQVTRPMLAVVTAIALATQVPLAIT